MKNRISRNRPVLCISLASIVFASAAWSPPGGDHTVQIGSPNTIGGSTAPLSNPSAAVNISPFRGFIGGINNVVGTSTSGFHGHVAGNGNFGNSYWSFVGGAQNRFALTGNASATSVRMMGLFGSYNVIANSNQSLIVTGYSNSVNAVSSLAAGSVNTMEGPGSGTHCNYSAVIGLSNHVVAASGWGIGQGNTVRSDRGVAIGTGNTAGRESVGSDVIQGAVAIGRGVLAEKTDSTALGRFNAAMEDNDVLAIGSGSDNSNRFTALRVTDSGDVVLGKVQGDISMGQYGN